MSSAYRVFIGLGESSMGEGQGDEEERKVMEVWTAMPEPFGMSFRAAAVRGIGRLHDDRGLPCRR